jgi:hypothetical protein
MIEPNWPDSCLQHCSAAAAEPAGALLAATTAAAAAAAAETCSGLTLAGTPGKEVFAGTAAGVSGRLIGLWGCWQLKDVDGDPHSEEAAEPPALYVSHVSVSCFTHRPAMRTAASASESEQSSH